MRRSPALLVVSAVLIALVATLVVRTAFPSPVRIQLLAINDLHGHLEPPSGANGRIGGIEAGGAAYLAAHLARLSSAAPTLVVGAGDLVGASPIVSGLFHDEPVVEALNAMGLAVTSVGNHEFDEGIGELLRLTRGGCHVVDGCQDGDGFAGARFQYLAANVVRKRTGVPILPPVAVRTIGGITIGFIGLTYAGTRQIVPPAVNEEVTFLEEAETINAQAAALKARGVHAIVLLIHAGGRQGDRDSDGDPNGCAAFDGGIVPLVERLSPVVSLVVSGHTHAAYVCRIGGRLVTSAASYGRLITRISLEIDPARAREVRAEATNEIVTREIPQDPAISRIVEKYLALARRRASEVVGSITGDLRRAPNSSGRSPLGTVIADAQLAAARAAGDRDAAVAFMNAGGVRADLVRDGAASRDGRPVSFAELYAVQPFGNTLMVCTMTGEMIARLLEQQFATSAAGLRQRLLPSSGFTYRYNANAPAGQRVDRWSIRVDGKPIGPADSVRVVASDFLLAGGDGLTVLGESTDRVSIATDIEALVLYFRRNSPVQPPGVAVSP